MNVAMLETGHLAPKSKAIDAHIRNSYLLQEAFGWDLLYFKEDYAKHWHKSYDSIIIMYGAFYAPVNFMAPFVEKNSSAKLFWMTNEYNLGVNSFLNKDPRGYDCICNFERPIHKKALNTFHSINLNVLMWHKPNPAIPKKYGTIYYGTFRPDRQKYFKEYLQGDVYLSTSEKNFKKFQHEGCNPTLIKKLSWPYSKETLNIFKYSLYIEDEYTHTCYNHLANRFYEALFCNVILLFDISCKNTLSRAGLDVPEHFMVESYADMINKTKYLDKHYEDALNEQAIWNTELRQERQTVLDQLKQIVEHAVT